MRQVLVLCTVIAAFSAAFRAAEAGTNFIEVAVSYRERIALPPDAELSVELRDLSRADPGLELIASQRFAMVDVPMTVTLTYDPRVIRETASYTVSAAIWSGESLVFRTSDRYDAFGAEPIDIVLTMAPTEREISGSPRTISGVEWAVTEVSGEIWSHNEPATLSIDDQMRFSIFGGCNRFIGNLAMSEGTIAFPENFAGTLMACPDDVERHERAYLDALARVHSYVRYGSGLVLTDRSGRALLHFVERPD